MNIPAYPVQAMMRFSELGIRQRMSLTWAVLTGMVVQFNFHASTVYFGNKQIFPADYEGAKDE